MSDIHDEKLDTLLRARRIETARPDLAERIILRARGIRQNQTTSWIGGLKQLFAEFHLARPGYVLACTLILGLLVGFSTASDVLNVSAGNSETIPIHSFLYADEDVL
jgi:hypothetical protein